MLDSLARKHCLQCWQLHKNKLVREGVIRLEAFNNGFYNIMNASNALATNTLSNNNLRGHTCMYQEPRMSPAQ
jgi:hypothetical protein